MQTLPTFDVVERRIQTLTSILQKDWRRSLRNWDRKQVPAQFLRRLATLLNCGTPDDPDAKRVIAVTSTLTDKEFRIFIVSQSPPGLSNVSEFEVQQITKSSGTFEEVVKQRNIAKLPAHISDVWAAITSYDPTDECHFRSFCHFIVVRCFQKLSKRLYQDRERWNVSVREKINDWTPRSYDSVAVRWIDQPWWAKTSEQLHPTGLDGMTSREILKSGQLVTQWEFSAATLKSWAWLLAEMLLQIELSVKATEVAREQKRAEEEVEEIASLHSWCLRLYLYVHWKEDVVETLLTKTSLAYSFHFGGPLNKSDDTEPNVFVDMQEEPYENEGHQVLCHLHGIVAWHAAACLVLDGKSRQFTQSLFVGLVEVALTKLGPEAPDLMTGEEVIQEYLSRYPKSSPDVRSALEDIIRKNHTKAKFSGTTHAEATLMGLLTYFLPNSHFVNHGPPINEDNLQFLRRLIGLAPFVKAIGVDRKCCWCCDKLGSLLGDFKLPGSHGMLYAWSPPRIGLDVTVLQTLENILWGELEAVVHKKAWEAAEAAADSDVDSLDGEDCKNQ